MIRHVLVLGLLALNGASCSDTSTAADSVAATVAAPHVPLLPALPRMKVVMMSSLPLAYGEGTGVAELIAGRGKPHPLYAELNTAHDLHMADVLDDRMLDGADLLVLVQPRALAPKELVALDAYVRAGGRLLLFADPMLEWAGGVSGQGQPQRFSLISPLLAHWGVELIDPGLGAVMLSPSGKAHAGAILVHPGQFRSLSGKIGDGACRPGPQGYVARCAPGRGRAVLVADADVLAPEHIADPAETADPAEIGGPAASANANRHFIASLIGTIVAENTS